MTTAHSQCSNFILTLVVAALLSGESADTVMGYKYV